MKKLIKWMLKQFGYQISPVPQINEANIDKENLNVDISPEVKSIFKECNGYTMIGLERLNAIIESIDYICKYNIPGDIVECGVWRGGAMYAAAKALVSRGVTSKKIFLFDTFQVDAMYGTTNETIYDKNFLGKTVEESVSTGNYNKEDYEYTIDDVKKLLSNSGYPPENIVFKVGRVENTLPDDQILQVSLLRLDTDWYESTKHELETLYPKLVKGGVILIDDYGHWQGCRHAVDEYFNNNNDYKILLHRTDHTGRSAVKL